MAVNVVMTMLCLAGVTFYVRFLVALCRDNAGKAHRIFYGARRHVTSNLYAIAEPRERSKTAARAA
jgi:hypothetical protein